MRSAPGSRPAAPAGGWVVGALLLALAALLAWTAWQNQALRERVTALEEENRSLPRAPAPAPAIMVAPAALAVPLAGVASRAAPAAPPPVSHDPLAAYARLPAASSARLGPLEEAARRLGEPASRPATSPFGRP